MSDDLLPQQVRQAYTEEISRAMGLPSHLLTATGSGAQHPSAATIGSLMEQLKQQKAAAHRAELGKTRFYDLLRSGDFILQLEERAHVYYVRDHAAGETCLAEVFIGEVATKSVPVTDARLEAADCFAAAIKAREIVREARKRKDAPQSPDWLGPYPNSQNPRQGIPPQYYQGDSTAQYSLFPQGIIQSQQGLINNIINNIGVPVLDSTAPGLNSDWMYKNG